MTILMFYSGLVITIGLLFLLAGIIKKLDSLTGIIGGLVLLSVGFYLLHIALKVQALSEALHQ